MTHPDDIVPESLRGAAAREDFLTWLRALPLRSDPKAQLALGWAYDAGVELSESEYETVRQSGIDVV